MKPVDFNEPCGERTEAVGSLRGKRSLSVGDGIMFVLKEAEALSHGNGAFSEAWRFERHVCRKRMPDMPSHRVNGTCVRGLTASSPDGLKRSVGRTLILRECVADGIEEHFLLNPAAREGVHGKDGFDEGIVGERLLPDVEFGFFGFRCPRLPHLVEKHDDGLTDPGQNLHFCRDVRGAFRKLCDVDEIENDA